MTEERSKRLELLPFIVIVKCLIVTDKNFVIIPYTTIARLFSLLKQ